jgi:hypothetical protein
MGFRNQQTPFEYIAQNDAVCLGTVSTTNTSYEDVGNGSTTGYSSATFDIPSPKTYLVRIDTSAQISGAVGTIYFQLLVDGSAPGGQPVSASKMYIPVLNTRHRFNWCIPVSLAAGSRVLKLQWKVSSGTTATAWPDDGRCFTVTG